jgi:F0F1-type ATP synthase alpha subunit
VNDVSRFEHDLLAFADAHSGSLLAKIATKKALDDEIRDELKQALTEFKEQFKH